MLNIGKFIYLIKNQHINILELTIIIVNQIVIYVNYGY